MFIYLHGFASSSQSHKALELKRLLPGYHFVALDYEPHKIAHALPSLIEEVNQYAHYLPPDELFVLIGSSLGGFYAKLLARELDYIHHVVMINPALTPSRTLRRVIGENQNYQTGERFALTEDDVAAFAPYEALEVPETTGLTVLLDEGDEVIPYQEAVEHYRAREVVVYPGRSHAFEHLREALPRIKDAHRGIGL